MDREGQFRSSVTSSSFDFTGLPTRGLKEVLTSWTLSGSVRPVDALVAALGSLPDEDVERDWDPAAALDRCHRVLWGLLEPLVAGLPTDPAIWLDALPATSTVERTVTHQIVRPVDWGRTVRTNQGWPGPRGWEGVRFAGRRRHRERDSVLVRVVSWTVGRLLAVMEGATHLIDPAPETREPISALLFLRTMLPDVDEVDDSEVRAAERAGHPWNRLTPLTLDLLRLESDPLRYSEEVIYPDDDLRWRLFHLAVYGDMVMAFIDRGWAVRATTPLVGSSRLPTHVARRGDLQVDLWFEGTGVWMHYGAPEHGLTYQQACAAARSARQPLSPDCVAVRHLNEEVLSATAIETKWSVDPAYVVRGGYLQSLGYGVELVRLLARPTSVFTIGPSPVVKGISSAVALSPSSATEELVIGLADPWSIGEALLRETA
jgi:hypothetical protein